jgi:hypothetical protein
MYAIAHIFSYQRDNRYEAQVYDAENDNFLSFFIEKTEMDKAGLTGGDPALIKYHPDDQFAKVIPVNKIVNVELE